MVMRVAGEATSSKTEQVAPVNQDLVSTDNELIRMWKEYREQRIWEYPPTLCDFFARFTALFGYFYVIVNKDKLRVDAEVAKQTAELMVMYAKSSVTERDSNIRRAERSARSVNEYYLAQVAWAKGCISEMQTLLRLIGDEAKMTGSGNV